MGKSNRSKNKMVPQMMPTIPVASIENNKEINANDVPTANNSQHGTAKSHKKGDAKRKGKKSSKKPNANANAKEDKKLKLPNPTDKPAATLNQANDFERFVGTVRAYISQEKM